VVRHPRRCDLLRGHGGADRGRGPDEKGALNLEGASGLLMSVPCVVDLQLIHRNKPDAIF
jgi:hypothetical protein